MPHQDLSSTPPPFHRRCLCGLAQAISLPFINAIVTLQWMGLLLSSIYLIRAATPLWKEALILLNSPDLTGLIASRSATSP